MSELQALVVFDADQSTAQEQQVDTQKAPGITDQMPNKVNLEGRPNMTQERHRLASPLLADRTALTTKYLLHLTTS